MTPPQIDSRGRLSPRTWAAALLVNLAATAGCLPTSEPRCELGDADLNLRSASVDGSLLTLEVDYGGGCAEHEFEVWWGGLSAPSVPPVFPLELQHDSDGDPCEALIEHTIHIDLSVLADSHDGVMRVDLVSGPNGSRGLGQILYDPAVETSVPMPPDTLVIDTSCGTIDS